MAMRGTTTLMIGTALLALTACTANWDMQGVDPNDYYAVHPIKNTVEMQNETHVVHYAPGQVRLSDEEIHKLQAAFHAVSPSAADTVHLQMAEADMHNEARRQALVRTLHALGYPTGNIQIDASASMARDDIQVDVLFARVVSPDCPDWRRSPVTSYSNTGQGNFECATETDTGLMVADPHDLARGSGDVGAESERSSLVIKDYEGGKDYMPGTLGAGSGGSSSGSSGSSGSGSPASPSPGSAPGGGSAPQ